MNTAEVAIEHVLTGLLALCAFLLPLLSGLQFDEKLLGSEAFIGVLGLAYLFGILFDSLADTLLGPIEQRIRLRLATEFLEKSEDGTEVGYPGDPFPQDVLEFRLRGEQNARVDWMDSLRSRIRTSRGLAVFGFPAAMGIAIFLSAQHVGQVRWQWWPHLFVAFNLFLLSLAILILSHRFRKGPKDPDQSPPTRTNIEGWLESKFKSARTDQLLTTDRNVLMKRSKNRMRIGFWFYLLMQINSAIAVVTVVTWPTQPWAWVFIVPAVVAAAALPIAVWYRITETYMNFIYRKWSSFPVPETYDFSASPPARGNE